MIPGPSDMCRLAWEACNIVVRVNETGILHSSQDQVWNANLWLMETVAIDDQNFSITLLLTLPDTISGACK